MAYFKTNVPVLKAEFFELNYNNSTEIRKSLEFLVGNSANTILKQSKEMRAEHICLTHIREKGGGSTARIWMILRIS